jgi:hypothetical protein
VKRLLIAALLVSASNAIGQTIAWEKLEPMAIRTTRTDPVAFELQTSGSVSNVRLDYAGGGSLTLTPAGGGRFTGSIPAAKALEGYASDDVNHNFIGFARLLGSSGEVLSSFNTFVQVLDSRVPAVAIRDLGGNARATTRIVNLYRPGIGINDVMTAGQQFYGYFHDDFDFLQVLFSIPNYPGNRYHFGVRNNVSGIGLTIFNNATQYGSAGKLQGITVYPIDSFFDTAESAFSHELGHQWIMFLKNASLVPGPHWPPSTMARGIMGFNIPGSNVGGDFPYEITAVTSTTARVRQSAVTQEFSDFDLYLMGFIPSSAVAPAIVVQGTGCVDCVVPSTAITIQDVIAVNGARNPDVNGSQKSFRVANVVISRDRLLTDDEMAILEYFAERGEATTELPYTSGLARGTTKPFYLATRTIGHVDFRLTLPPPRRRSVKRH